MVIQLVPGGDRETRMLEYFDWESETWVPLDDSDLEFEEDHGTED